jgi:hypothetical protein
LRKLALLVAGVALSVGTLAACFGGPPPPDPRDVLVVGDSVSFSFGCVLGDPGELGGVPQSACTPAPGATYTTRNDWVGACTITPGTLSLYNGGQAGAPNCDTVGAGSRGDTWQSDADHFVPKVVVINTAGWEIVDRWMNFVSAPDEQWGAAGCHPNNAPSPQCDAYSNAAQQYSSRLFDAINVFRNSANHPTVIVTNTPYINPLEPEPPFGSGNDALSCSWWEPFPNSPQQSQGPDCAGDATQGSGGFWRSPTGNTSYRSSQLKMDQFNEIVQFVKSNNFAGDPAVKVFNFKSHFNAGPANTYTDWVCPPPQDSTVTAVNVLDWHTANPLDMAFQCDNGQGPNSVANPWTYAINARAPDHSHLSPAGQTQILQPYIDKCVRAALGASGGDPAACN